MRTNVTATSLAAHDSIIGSLTEECHRKIASVMEPGVFYTRKQIAYMLNMETSSVAGRVNRMIELEVIEVSGQIRCPVSGRMVEAIKLAPAQKDMF